MATSEFYISIDVETDGPCPGINSMLSLGAAAFSPDGKLWDGREWHLYPLPLARTDPNTMEWWTTQPDAWNILQKDQLEPEEAISAFRRWVNNLVEDRGGIPTALCAPAGFDWPFVYYYLHRFPGTTDSSLFGFRVLDTKSIMHAITGKPAIHCTKGYMPKRWLKNTKHDHTALVDAIGQGEMYFRMMKDAQK